MWDPNEEIKLGI